MNSRIFLLTVAVAAVGLFAMPNTLTLFSGQHTFYNGSAVNCAKCHQDIVDEALTNAGNNAPHYTIMDQSGRARCEVCHTTGEVSNIPAGKDGTGGFDLRTQSLDVTSDTKAHAAVKVECVSCHVNVTSEITGTNATHAPYYDAANQSYDNQSDNGFDILKGSNEACVACHTHIMINITWVRSIGYNMNVSESPEGYYVINLTSVNSSTNTTYSAGQ